tara:strand:- start:265 stop:570 length:306 start_codon:yes stop_codon:yes gene_type:complete
LIVGPNDGREGRNESVELFDQDIHIHTVHERPVLQGIELNGKTTPTTHIEAIEKLHGPWVSAYYFINGGFWCDEHKIIQNHLPRNLLYAASKILSNNVFVI